MDESVRIYVMHTRKKNRTEPKKREDEEYLSGTRVVCGEP